MLADPHVGERDPRSEDRQLLLDALLAATEQLIITYTGNDERTNTPRPPAVPVGELLDAVDATVRCAADPERPRRRAGRRPPSAAAVRPANFAAGALAGERPWSFDRVALGGARALIGDRAAPAPFLAAPLPRARRPGGRPRRPGPLRRASGRARSCASGWASCCATAPTRSTTGCRSSSTASSAGASASACSRRGCTGPTAAWRSRPSAPAACCRPACSAIPAIRQLYPIVDAIAAEAETRCSATPADRRSGRRPGRAARRPAAQRHGGRGQRRPAADHDVLPRGGQAPAGRLGPAAGAHRRLARAAVRGGHRRPRPGPRRRPRRRDRGRWPTIRTSAGGWRWSICTRCRPVRPRDARAAADLLQDLGGLRRGGRPPGRTPRRRRSEEWESDFRFDREDQELEHQLVLGGELTLA